MDRHDMMAWLARERGEDILRLSPGAAAGIGDYWVIDIDNLQIHQYRNPQPNPTQPYGYWYGQHQVLLPQDHIGPLALPPIA